MKRKINVSSKPEKLMGQKEYSKIQDLYFFGG